MKTILKIQTSLFGADGQSSQLADAFIANYRKRQPDSAVVVRDLVTDPVPPLTLERFQALTTKVDDRTDAQRAVAAYSDTLIAELNAADVIVFAVPMYNFNIPAGLHNYFDHIARAGVTFRYTENGPEGLIKGKEVMVFVTRGGNYGADHSQSAYLRQFLSFIGLVDARFVLAEGLAISDESREQSLTHARREITRLLRPIASAA
ncbi:MAG: NAD(P)H-dependent oxidoreductase [Gammaproteobacteria bacterium]